MEATTASAMSEVREMSANQLGLLLAKLFAFASRPQLKKLLPAFERRYARLTRLFDVRADVKDMRILTTFALVFGELHYESDSFWEFLTDIVASNFAGLAWPEKVETMRAYSRAKRGSNELWQFFIENSLAETGIDQLERDIALTCFAGEAELPRDIVPSDSLDTSHLAAAVQKTLQRDSEAYVGSSNCEDLAYLVLFHPWTTAEEAQVFENLLRNSYHLISVPSIVRINQMYEKAKKKNSLKTTGIDDLINK